MGQKMCVNRTYPGQPAECSVQEQSRRLRSDYIRRLGIGRANHEPLLVARRISGSFLDSFAMHSEVAACTGVEKEPVRGHPRTISDASTAATESDLSVRDGSTKEQCDARTRTSSTDSTMVGESALFSSDDDEDGSDEAELSAPSVHEDRRPSCVPDVQQDFRLELLQKLSYSRIWVPPLHRKPRSQTVIIFDWDDTLLCTSYLTSRGIYEAMPFLPAIQKVVAGLLEMASRAGKVFIITNATHGWVQQSASQYLPGLLPVLRDVQIVSARWKFEGDYPNDASQWKIRAFMEVKREVDAEAVANLISVGDSLYEMDAACALGKALRMARTKTVKLISEPSPRDLLAQLQIVSREFPRIVDSGHNLRFGLEPRNLSRNSGRLSLRLKP